MSKTPVVADLPPPNPYQNYRPATVARYTGLSPRTIYHLCKKGVLRHVRIGDAITIQGSEVMRLNGHATTP